MLIAVALLAVGVVLESVDVALLSLLPLTAYAVNAAMEPPKFSIAKRRLDSTVEIVIEADRRPGVFYIYEPTPVDAAAPPLIP